MDVSALSTIVIGLFTLVAAVLVLHLISRTRWRARTRSWTAGPAMLALASGLLSVLLLGAPAAAHTDLVSVNPADGSRLERAPRELFLEFSEEMNPALSIVTLAVDGGDSTRLEVDNGRSPSTLVATVPAAAVAEADEATRWRAAFRVVSADGHPVAGETSFMVLSANSSDDEPGASRTPAPQSLESDPKGSPPEPEEIEGGVPWLLVAIPVAVLSVLFLVVAAAMRLHGRGREH